MAARQEKMLEASREAGEQLKITWQATRCSSGIVQSFCSSWCIQQAKPMMLPCFHLHCSMCLNAAWHVGT